jgi:hypothetical protein
MMISTKPPNTQFVIDVFARQNIKGFCRIVPQFLSAAECATLKAKIGKTQSASSHYPPSYRNNLRSVFDDPELAERLSVRLQFALGTDLTHLPFRLFGETPEGSDFVGINPHWRGCQYLAGQQFNLHQDGVFYLDATTRSRLSFMIYLDDAADFGGGDTIFYQDGPGTAGAQIEIARVRPCLGSLIIFEHALWHAGAVVTHGSKSILRSDLLYRDRNFGKDAHTNDHLGYVFTLVNLAPHIYASGGRDGTIRLWRDAQCAGVLRGHSQSVLKLVALGADYLAAISRDRSVSIWHWRTQKCVAQCPNAFDATPLDLIALTDTVLLISDATGHMSRFEFRNAALHLIEQVCACGQGKHAPLNHSWIWALGKIAGGGIISVDESGTVALFDGQLKLIAELKLDAALRALICPDTGYLGAASLASELFLGSFTPDFFCGDADGKIYWLRIQGTTLKRMQSWQAHTAAIRCLRWDENGQLWSGGEDNQLRVWHVDSQTKTPECSAKYTFDGFVTDVLPPHTFDRSCVLVAGYAGQHKIIF